MVLVAAIVCPRREFGNSIGQQLVSEIDER